MRSFKVVICNCSIPAFKVFIEFHDCIRCFFDLTVTLGDALLWLLHALYRIPLVSSGKHLVLDPDNLLLECRIRELVEKTAESMHVEKSGKSVPLWSGIRCRSPWRVYFLLGESKPTRFEIKNSEIRIRK